MHLRASVSTRTCRENPPRQRLFCSRILNRTECPTHCQGRLNARHNYLGGRVRLVGRCYAKLLVRLASCRITSSLDGSQSGIPTAINHDFSGWNLAFWGHRFGWSVLAPLPGTEVFGCGKVKCAWFGRRFTMISCAYACVSFAASGQDDRTLLQNAWIGSCSRMRPRTQISPKLFKLLAWCRV